MKQYLDLGEHILLNGIDKGDRTGTGTRSVFGYQMRFDLSKGFPLEGAKAVPMRLIAEELFWFLSGNTDAAELAKKKVNIWTPDAYRWHKAQGGTMTREEFKEYLLKEDAVFDLGPIYGAQWRSWGTGVNHNPHYNIGKPREVTIDQIADLIEQIKNNPDSRRLIVSAWNVGQIDNMALPPCHCLFQFYVANGKLSCQLYQRSGDYFLGVPFNIASYALLTHMIAQVTELEVGEFVHTLGDVHIYNNHIKQVQEMISRSAKPMPQIELNPDIKNINDFTWEDIKLIGYDPHPTIKGKVSVG